MWGGRAIARLAVSGGLKSVTCQKCPNGSLPMHRWLIDFVLHQAVELAAAQHIAND